MTELLEKAFAEAAKLSPDDQDSLAERWLAELADEQAWAARFKATTDQQWDRLTDRVRREIAAGDTTPLDDLFPPSLSQP